jgi:hypothetical protein
MHQLLLIKWGNSFGVLELEFSVKSSEKTPHLVTFSRQKDESFKVVYTRLLKLKEDTQSIINLEVAHKYLCSLEGTLTFHA